MPTSYIVDMDGVIYHGHRLIPGVLDFLEKLRRGGHKFLFLTNNSQWTPRDLSHRLGQIGIDVDESSFHTSALATADFLHRQKPGGTAYVIGGAGLTHALYSVGYTLTEHNPDYVVVGDTRSYDFEKIERASRLISGGARFVATNLDLTGPSEQGIQPACGALVAPIELVTGRKPYFVGKPNPLMMRTALRKLDAHSADSFMVGDRMDTDILAGTEAGMRTILVLSGVSTRETVEQYPFRPTHIFENVGEIPVESLI
ncbi:NagD protein [Singulisphaera sp. GP187]|uniref:HAD-IIA family hydrolase n=1 Tax=Singulisphaera sp. GP187 TaxID=1882752 RepID=UPI00092B8525|nr:HAD-IIA family hydrolase [Singulisphaera sp. GP187]SIO61866.1 NagD protein [Singulisphaera sp. GP187]